MNSNKVAVQESQQNLTADGQDAVNFGRREGSVEEESNLEVDVGANFLSQHGWYKEEVEIVDPDNVSVLDIFGDRLRKYSVGFLVC